MARIDKDTATKAAITIQFMQERRELEDKIKERDEKIILLEKELKSAKRGISIYSTPDDIAKKILEIRSTYASPVRIMEKLRYIGVDIEIEKIKDIIYNISELSLDLQVYFKECEEKYEKEIKINPQSLRDSSLKEITYLMDLAMESIEASVDPNEKDKYIRTFKDLLNTKTAILKDVVFGDDESEINEEVMNMKEDIRKNSKILNFDKEKIINFNG